MRTDQPEVVVKAGVAVVVVNSEGLVLVGKRKGSHGSGQWAFPGGHIDPTDKELYAACEREVFEETGMVVNCFSPDQFRKDLFTTFDILSEDGKKRYVTVYVVANYMFGGKYALMTDGFAGIVPREPDKCEGWYWKSIEQIAELVYSGDGKAWIPLNQVAYYLKKLEAECPTTRMRSEIISKQTDALPAGRGRANAA